MRFFSCGFWALLILSTYSCREPTRAPQAVPKDATWAGGPDGGVYVRCDVDGKADLDVCTVWNDYSGKVVDQGSFQLLKERRAATKSELLYAWADGAGTIGLKKGLILRKVDRKSVK